MKKELIISVIIPTYRDWVRLEKCIQALMNQTLSDAHYEIIAINNDAKELVPASIRNSFPQVQFLDETRPGSYAARNHGLASARGSIIAFIDSDCEPDDKWLESALNQFRDHPEFDRIAGRVQITVPDNPTHAELWDKLFAFPQKKYVAQGFSVTANLIVRKTVLDEVGLFDPTLLSGGDYEWNKRATAQGYHLEYRSDVVVLHPARQRAELLNKVRRVAAKYFKLHEKRSFFRKAITGFYIFCTPPIQEIKTIYQTDQMALTSSQKLGVSIISIMRRLVEGYEHFRLLFGGERIRT